MTISLNGILTMKALNLFCLPFAGGNKYSYREFEEKAPSFIKIIPLEYPGRGARIKEPPISDFEEVVKDVYKQVRNNVGQMDYAIYGHSMGGLVAYLLTKKLIDNNHKAPLHLFITGTPGPSAASRFVKIRHLLPRKEFIQEVKDMGGIPDGILQDETLIYFFEAILRADFKACENYVYKETAPLNIPFTVITGREDDLVSEDVILWQKETKSTVDFRQLPGNHFFIFQYPAAVIEIISKKLFHYTKRYRL